MTPASAERAFIGLGANLGDAAATLRAAIDAIDALPLTRCVARSSLYRSAPVDAGGPDYVNAVVEVETALPPGELLAALLAIEQAHGRVRDGRFNAPRPLDLDLLLHGRRVVETPALTLPHPRLHRRAFVLRPLAEIAPALDVPGHGRVDALSAQLEGQQRVEKLA